MHIKASRIGSNVHCQIKLASSCHCPAGLSVYAVEEVALNPQRKNCMVKLQARICDHDL